MLGLSVVIFNDLKKVVPKRFWRLFHPLALPKQPPLQMYSQLLIGVRIACQMSILFPIRIVI